MPNKIWNAAIKILNYNMNYQVIFAKELKHFNVIWQNNFWRKKEFFCTKKPDTLTGGRGPLSVLKGKISCLYIYWFGYRSFPGVTQVFAPRTVDPNNFMLNRVPLGYISFQAAAKERLMPCRMWNITWKFILYQIFW